MVRVFKNGEEFTFFPFNARGQAFNTPVTGRLVGHARSQEIGGVARLFRCVRVELPPTTKSGEVCESGDYWVLAQDLTFQGNADSDLCSLTFQEVKEHFQFLLEVGHMLGRDHAEQDVQDFQDSLVDAGWSQSRVTQALNWAATSSLRNIPDPPKELGIDTGLDNSVFAGLSIESLFE
jgi:hypothetical protein